MSYLNTKQALLTQLVGNLPTGVSDTDIAFENRRFDPAGKPIWLAAYFIPVSSESTGKTLSSSNEQRGIFQISVYVSVNDDENYDDVQLGVLVELATAFRYNTQMSFSNQNVHALDCNINAGSESGGWYKRDFTLDYLTFSGK